jgi:hypothetical protein
VQQVVQAVPAGCCLLQQVYAGERFEEPGRVRRAGAGERGGGRDADVCTRVQAEQPEHAGRGGRQAVVRPGEYRTDSGITVLARGQRVQAVLFGGEFGGQPGQGQPGPVRGAFRGDPHGERKERAAGGDGGGGGRLGIDTGVAEELPQQAHGLRLGQRADRDRHGAAAGEQAGEPAAAGDQYQAAGCAGQQRPDLGGGPGIVQQDDHLPASQQRPVKTSGLVLIGGDVIGCCSQGAQEPAQRLGRRHRSDVGVPVQVHMQLPLRKTVRDLVGPVHRQRRLPRACRPGDDGDGGCRRARPGQQSSQLAQLGGAAGEVTGASRKLARDHRLSRRGERGVPGQDLMTELLQWRGRLDPQIPDHPRVQGTEFLQCFGLPARPVQRQHQLAANSFPQRLLSGQGAQPADQAGTAAERELGVGPGLLGRQAAIGQRVKDGGVVAVQHDVPGRLAPPQRERFGQQPGRLRGVSMVKGMMAPGSEIIEHGEVEVAGGQD